MLSLGCPDMKKPHSLEKECGFQDDGLGEKPFTQ